MSRHLLIAIGCVIALLGCEKKDTAPVASAAPKPATTQPVAASTSSYAGEGLSLQLKTNGSDLTGTIALGAKSYPIMGTVAADGSLSGTFDSNGKTFNWSATRDGANLRFKTGETEYSLKPEAESSDNPLAKKPEATPVPPTAAQSAAPGGIASAKPQTPASTSARTNNPGNAIKLTKLSVHDPGINNIEAISFLIPDGWKTEGGITWFPDYSVLCNLLMKITDPQTGAQIEFLPIQNFTFLSNPVVPMAEGTNYLGNIIHRPVQDLAEIVSTFYTDKAAPHLANAKLQNREELTKIEQLVQQSWGGQTSVKSERLRYTYEHSGKPWDEDVYLTAVYTPSQLGVFWSVTSACSLRAPHGVLDELTPLMTTTVTSARLSPDWFAGYMYVQQLFNNRQMQGIANAKAISDTVTRNSEEIRKMFADSYRQQQESQDRIAQARSEQIRGVETYHNPYEDRSVELPAGYNNVWVNRQGEYILSDTAGFDPNVGSNVEWSQLKQAR